jgi:putative heme-binding domain-containing protein
MRNESAQCTRCHTFGNQGADVGPSLGTIGARLGREQLLEALVDPDARIAPGFGRVMLTLRGGEIVNGPIQEDTETFVTVIDGRTGRPRVISRSEIVSRTDAASTMPRMQNLLTRRQLRDVVEYLTTLR